MTGRDIHPSPPPSGYAPGNGAFAGLAAKLLADEATQWIWYEDHDRNSDSVCLYYIMLCRQLSIKLVAIDTTLYSVSKLCHLLSFDLDLTFDLDHRRREEFVLGGLATKAPSRSRRRRGEKGMGRGCSALQPTRGSGGAS